MHFVHDATNYRLHSEELHTGYATFRYATPTENTYLYKVFQLIRPLAIAILHFADAILKS